MTDLTQTGPGPAPRPGLWPRLAPWLWVGLFALAAAPTALWLWQRWTLGIWHNGHAVLMPLIVAYLAYEELRDDPAPEDARASAWGFAFLVPSLGLLAADSAMGTQILSAIALVIALPGLSLLLLGAARTRRLAFPFVIATFALPIPAGAVDPIILVLRQISTWGAMQIIPHLGFPVYSEKTFIILPHHALDVAEPCSGFSTLYAAITTALILAHWSRSWAKRVQLLVAAIIGTLICNSVRVAVLAWIVHHYGLDPLDTPLHELTGMVMFVFVLIGLFLLAGRETLRPRSA